MTKDYEDRRLALAADMNRMGGAAMLDMADSIRRDRDAVERARAVLDRLEPEDRDAVNGAFDVVGRMGGGFGLEGTRAALGIGADALGLAARMEPVS